MIERRRLGSSDLYVSALALGTMEFGRATPETGAARLVENCREAGINLIDVGDAYTDGDAERIVGRLIRLARDYWIVTTKVGTGGGLGRAWMMQAIDESLKRLGLGYIDIWCLHHEDNDTPLEETISAIGDVIRAGKVRYWGFSNFHAWKIAEFIRIADATGVARPVMAQPFYNLLNRMAEKDYIPACAHFDIGVMPYSPLARGVLTGKYTIGGTPPANSRVARANKRMIEVDFRTESLAVAKDLGARLAQRNISLPAFAVRWLLENRATSSVVAGPRTVGQLRSYLEAFELEWAEGCEALIDSLVAPGHSSTPGFTDPKYPVVGRFPRPRPLTL